MQGLVSAFERMLGSAVPQDIFNALWAAATAGFHVPAATWCLCLSTLYRLVAGNPDAPKLHLAVCNSCWAVAHADQRHVAPDVIALCAQASRSNILTALQLVDLAQLHTTHVWLLQHKLAGGRGLAGALSPELLRRCAAAAARPFD